MKLIIIASLLFSVSLAQSGKTSDTATGARVTGVALKREVIKEVEPVYPPIGKAARASGEVKVEVTIDGAGKVVSARAVSGHPLLRDPAEAAARQWKFKPTTVSGKPAKLNDVLIFNFVLDDDKKSEAEDRASLDPAKARLDRGTAFLESNRFDDAITEFREAVRISPDDFFAHGKLGVAYIRAGRHAEGEATCEEAVIIAREKQRDDFIMTNLLMCVGMSKLYLGKYDGSIKAFKEAAEMNPAMFDVRIYLGIALRRKGDNEAAIAALKDSVALKQTANAYFLLGEIYLEQNRMKEAIDSYKQCIELEDGPFVPQSRFSLGTAFLRLGDKQSAMNEYHALKKINNPILAEQLLREINK